MKRVTILTGVLLVAGTALAGTRVFVELAGRDESLRKLGRPGIALRIAAQETSLASAVGDELARELREQVHTRRLDADEAGDYDLTVSVDEPSQDGPVTTVAFEAILVSSRGERLWRIAGRAEIEDSPVDSAVYAGIGRNVVSALIHDGWLQQRYDPDNPPPQPPHVR